MDDDLDLSMVDLDDLEKSAKSQLAERQRSSFAASVPHHGHSNNTWQNHDRPTSFSSPVKQVLPPSPSKSLGRTSTHPVKFFYDQAGRIGLKTMYNKVTYGSDEAQFNVSVMNMTWVGGQRVSLCLLDNGGRLQTDTGLQMIVAGPLYWGSSALYLK